MKQIFLVEDDSSLINRLSFAIKKQGYDIDIARTVLEADKMWEDGKYDLVILDVSLPDGSGFDLCKKILQTSKVPVMFLTALDEETDIMHYFDRSASVAGKKDIILSANTKKLLGVNKGDSIILDTPSGSYNFTISGFRLDDKKWINSNGGEDSAIITKENEIAAFINIEVFQEICNNGNPDTIYYIQLKKYRNIRRVFSEIKEQCKTSDKNIEVNKMLMATMGFSDSQYIMNIYGIAACLLLMVLLAGIFMISGSLNSNIAERLQFFGMMRCIGASKKQIMRLVRMKG